VAPPPGLDSVTVNVSASSSRLSFRMVIAIVFVVSPAPNVSTPFAVR